MALKEVNRDFETSLHPRMNRELFGVFGDRQAFRRFRSRDEFHRLVSGNSVTIGVRDDGLAIDGRSSMYQGSHGCAAVWGEVFPPPSVSKPTAQWLYERVRESGDDAYHQLNGSYIAVVDVEDSVNVVPDLIRSHECFYTDAPGTRVFGTDAAAVGRAVESPSVDGVGLNQLLYFGVVFEDRTILEELARLRFDSILTADGSRELDRITYRPVRRTQEEHARQLATRIMAAIDRRLDYPRPKGILSSAGFDSRLMLSTVPDLDVSYTLGTPSTPEVITAQKLASQYGIDHRVLPVTPSYLKTTEDIVQYTNGIRESLHIHHRGNEDLLDATTIYHGLLLDTVLRDIYLPRRRIEAFGHAFPLPGLVSDPDTFAYMEERLGIYNEGGRLLAHHPDGDGIDERAFLDQTMTTALDGCWDRSESIHDAMSLLGLKVTQALPFHTHLADNHYESLVAADTNLIEWHLTTPARQRNSRTYQLAMEHIDDELLTHRPPDRPHRSHILNQVEGYLRRQIPLIPEPGTPWPDRDAMYDRLDLDKKLFPDAPAVHPLPARVKLRINDALVWLETATGREHRAGEYLRLD